VSDLKFCPECGAQLAPGDRFCGECGFDTDLLAASAAGQPMESRPAHTPASAPAPAASHQPSNQPEPTPSPASASQPLQASAPRVAEGQPAAAGNFENIGVKSTGNKNALVIMISLLAVLFLAGGGIYWWLSRGEEPGTESSVPGNGQNQTASPSVQNAPSASSVTDLTRASAYLSEPGLKCTFFVNYPDGTSGVVDRFSGKAVPDESVQVSEVETGVDQGEEFGFGFHYVERADGTYYILDNTPYEIFPVLKNNLTVGQTWNYQDEYGTITWTVMDMGVDLDLGFAVFEDCIMVREDNQPAQYYAITYYAPGRGNVFVTDTSGSFEYYRMTGMTKIEPAQAAETIIKWCPNYTEIKDDRTQSY